MFFFVAISELRIRVQIIRIRIQTFREKSQIRTNPHSLFILFLFQRAVDPNSKSPDLDSTLQIKKTGSFPKITLHSVLLCCNIRAGDPGLDSPDPSLQKTGYKFEHPKNLIRIQPFIRPSFAVISWLRIRV